MCCSTARLGTAQHSAAQHITAYLEWQQHLSHDALGTRRRAELAVCNLQPQWPTLCVHLTAHHMGLDLVHFEAHTALQACCIQVAHKQGAVGAKYKAATSTVRHQVHLQRTQSHHLCHNDTAGVDQCMLGLKPCSCKTKVSCTCSVSVFVGCDDVQ